MHLNKASCLALAVILANAAPQDSYATTLEASIMTETTTVTAAASCATTTDSTTMYPMMNGTTNATASDSTMIMESPTPTATADVTTPQAYDGGAEALGMSSFAALAAAVGAMTWIFAEF